MQNTYFSTDTNSFEEQQVIFTFAVTPVMVNYKADINGKISGLTIEEVHKGDNPIGTKIEVNKGYVFKNWTADKDLYDNSGKLYKKGDKFSDNELKTMQIEEDTVFTAHFGKLTGSLKINKTN